MEYAKDGGVPTAYERVMAASAVAEGLQPRYVFAPRLAGRLACGELAIEPVLGPLRVAEARQATDEHGDGDHSSADAPVFISWRDEHGPCTAMGRYPADSSFLVRMPAYGDRLMIRRGIDQAEWHGQEVSGDTARLIAAHLHPGQRSALHRLVVDGSIGERVYDELDVAARQRAYARQWVHALTRYCLARDDLGPVRQWTRQTVAEAEARAEEWLNSAGVSVKTLEQRAGNGNGSTGQRNGNRYRPLLERKRMSTETATRLIDAAFLLGVAAARKRVLPAEIENGFGEWERWR